MYQNNENDASEDHKKLLLNFCEFLGRVLPQRDREVERPTGLARWRYWDLFDPRHNYSNALSTRMFLTILVWLEKNLRKWRFCPNESWVIVDTPLRLVMIPYIIDETKFKFNQTSVDIKIPLQRQKGRFSTPFRLKIVKISILLEKSYFSLAGAMIVAMTAPKETAWIRVT